MESTETKERTLGYFIIIIAVFTWSMVEISVKILQGSVGPITLSFFRYLIGGSFLFTILLMKGDLSGILKMIRNNWKLFILISLFTTSFSNVLYFTGVTFTQANIASAILTTYPIWITIFSFFILNEKSNLKLKFIGIILGFSGVAILITNFNFTGFFKQENLLGNILVLCGSIIWGFYTPLGKKIQNNEENTSNCALKFTSLSFLFSAIILFVILPFTPEFSTFMSYSLDSWLWILFLGVISTGFGQFIFFLGVKHIEVSKGISLAFLKPIFATILAFFILQEEPTLALLVSIGLISISVILINRKKKNLTLKKNKR